MEDAVWTCSFMAFGALIGVATLPWKHRISHKEGAFLYIVSWACFWPFIVVYLTYFVVSAYIRSWWDYSDRVASARRNTKNYNE